MPLEGGAELAEVPVEIGEGKRDIAPLAHITAQEMAEQLAETFNPKKPLEAQRFEGPGQRAKQLVEEMLTPHPKNDPETNWQKQWMTVFEIFHNLGISRGKGEGNGRGSDEARFAARAVQSHLLESSDSKLRAEGASRDPAIQQRQLKNTASFALAAAAVDRKRNAYNPGEPVLETLERATLFRAREDIWNMVEEDRKINNEDNQRFHLRNL